MNWKHSAVFHRMSKHLQITPEERLGEWSEIDYKTYPRLPKVALGDSHPRADLFEIISNRKSQREFGRSLVSKDDLAVLLKYSCGAVGFISDGRQRRAQPSGGARFPIEVYPIIFRSGEDLKAGLYHYDIKHHQLDILWEREFSDEDIGQLFTYPWVKDAAIGIVMTAVFWRNQNKYGERGYRYVLQEAGHIGQNMYLVSEALGLKCCALGGTRDENLEKLIDIDGVTESVVYALAVGK